MASVAASTQWMRRLPVWRAEFLLLPLALIMFVALTAPMPLRSFAAFCLSPAASTGRRLTSLFSMAWQSGALQTSLLHWTLMVLTMVPLLSLPTVRFVMARSYVQRRARAAAVFLGAVISTWVIAGVLLTILLLMAPLPAKDQAQLISGGFLLAAAWQLTPWKQLALRACHRTAPLCASGWRADAHCLRYGTLHGLRCVGSCWALMLACMLADHQLLYMGCAWWIAIHERTSHSPRTSVAVLTLSTCALIPFIPRLLP